MNYGNFIWQVFFLCLMAGCSICWFNTVCYVLCINNFATNKALALSLTISYNGVSAAIYTLIANAINPQNDTLYLLLNASVPLFVSVLALLSILPQPPQRHLSPDATHRDSSIFVVLNVLAIITGLYLLLLDSLSSSSTACFLLGGAILLLVLPLGLPGIVCARNWARHTIHRSFHYDRSSFNLVDTDDLDLDLVKELMGSENSNSSNGNSHGVMEKGGCFACSGRVMEKNRFPMLGEEHSAPALVCRWDFWIYYVVYFCGGTIGLVYSNNLGQIAQSLGYSDLSSLVTLYSSCSFFGRLLSAAPDFLREYVFTIKLNICNAQH